MRPIAPPVLCIVGKKNAGKTTVTLALAAELKRRGLRVMTVKHGHGFQVDQPGRDSWRHRHEAGALRTVLAGARDFAVIGMWPEDEMPLSELVLRFLWDADIVLAEGFKKGPEPRILVHRGTPPPEAAFEPDPAGPGETIAVVTDDTAAEVSVPVFAFGAPDCAARLADLVQERIKRECGP